MGFGKESIIGNMAFLWEGIQFGLILSIMTGPILFALIQVGVEEGLRAGIVLGLGIWLSDLIFILGVNYGLQYALDFIGSGSGNTIVIGIIGGIILILFGLGNILSKPPKVVFEVNEAKRHSSWLSLWTKGFLINTVNPFTFLFWIGITSKILIKENSSPSGTTLFFMGIMGTVMLTDFLKLYLSKEIRKKLQTKHLQLLRYISGGALVLFGIALMIRVLFL